MERIWKEQYNQIWQQRRQHVGLYWKIPTVAGGFLGLIIKIVDFKGFSPSEIDFLFSLFLIYSAGVVGLFLRHNFFQKVYGLVLRRMDKNNKALRPTPQFGKQLRKQYYRGLDFWEKIGAYLNGMYCWMLIMLSAMLFVIFMWVRLTHRDIWPFLHSCC